MRRKKREKKSQTAKEKAEKAIFEQKEKAYSAKPSRTRKEKDEKRKACTESKEKNLVRKDLRLRKPSSKREGLRKHLRRKYKKESYK